MSKISTLPDLSEFKFSVGLQNKYRITAVMGEVRLRANLQRLPGEGVS